jgi:hypothetical protein
MSPLLRVMIVVAQELFFGVTKMILIANHAIV